MTGKLDAFYKATRSYQGGMETDPGADAAIFRGSNQIAAFAAYIEKETKLIREAGERMNTQ